MIYSLICCYTNSTKTWFVSWSVISCIRIFYNYINFFQMIIFCDLLSWINDMHPLSQSTFSKPRFRQQAVCKFDMTNDFYHWLYPVRICLHASSCYILVNCFFFFFVWLISMFQIMFHFYLLPRTPFSIHVILIFIYHCMTHQYTRAINGAMLCQPQISSYDGSNICQLSYHHGVRSTNHSKLSWVR